MASKSKRPFIEDTVAASTLMASFQTVSEEVFPETRLPERCFSETQRGKRDEEERAEA